MMKPKLIVNDDGTFLFDGDNLSERDLREYLKQYAETQVDLLAYCVSFGGGRCLYDTTAGIRFFAGGRDSDDFQAQRVDRNYETLGKDYIRLVFDILQGFGIKYLASIRMNDCHYADDSCSWAAGRLALEHPEYRLGKGCESEYYSYGMDYAIPAVREFYLEMITEVIEKIPDVAGIELDMMRSPFFFKLGGKRENIPVMTEFVRQARELLDSKKSGYMLTVNLPASPKYALSQGLDGGAWAHEHLVDIISAGSYLNDMLIPVEAWRKVLPSGFPFYCYTNCSQQMGNYMSLENYRAAAANAFGAGADGVYIFNYCCFEELALMMPTDPGKPLFPSPPFPGTSFLPDIDESKKCLHELGAPETIKHKNKHFQFYMADQREPHWSPGPIPLCRTGPTATQAEFRCYDDFQAAAEITLSFIIAGIAASEEFGFSLNGAKLDEAKITRRHAWRGRDQRLQPEPLPPYSNFNVTLQPEQLRNGVNMLTVTMIKSAPGFNGKIEFRELELKINF